MDRDTGIQRQREVELQEVYPVSVVTDADGVQGSCVFFRERVDVSADVRAPLTLDQAQSR